MTTKFKVGDFVRTKGNAGYGRISKVGKTWLHQHDYLIIAWLNLVISEFGIVQGVALLEEKVFEQDFKYIKKAKLKVQR